MRFFGLLFVIVTVGFLIGFVVLNSQQHIDLDIFGQKVANISVAMACFYSFIAGMTFILVFALVDEISLRNALRRLRREKEDLQTELNALRNLPFEEEK